MMLHKLRRRRGAPQQSSALVAIRSDIIEECSQLAAAEEQTVVQVVNELLSFALAQRRSSDRQLLLWEQLTAREKEVTALVWLGLTNQEIGAQLSISRNTVKTHMRNVLGKFEVNSKEALREKLALLDFSEWVAMLVEREEQPFSTASPHGATP